MSLTHRAAPWTGITHITLVTDDLAASRSFYSDVLELKTVFEDDVSAAFALGGIIINALASTAADELVEPRPVAPSSAGSRVVLTLTVDDVDVAAARLAQQGVVLLNGPVNRPWGIRTAAFCDPGGHCWELAGPAAEA